MIFESRVIRILLVEDDEGDAKLLRRSFAQVKSFRTEILHATRLKTALRELVEEDFDVVLLDLSLPDGDGFEVIDRVKQVDPQVPIVVLTGLNDENSALEAVKRGAHEYLVKGQISSSFLPKVVRYAIESSRHTRELEHTKIELKQEVESQTTALREAHARALRSERLAAVGQMVTGLAHESRNAMQRIQASVNRLRRRARDNKELCAIGEDIDVALDDLRHLYDTVREYATPLHLVKVPSNLCELWSDAISKVESVNTTSHIETVDRSPTKDPMPVVVDTHAVQQVFRNIIENAVQACSDEAVQFFLYLESVILYGRSYLSLIIQDSGPGLGDEEAKHIFEPFFTTKSKGTGLGLAISRRIVEEHGGHLDLPSEDMLSCEQRELLSLSGLKIRILFPLAQVGDG
ncbi:response regulator [bacterium]|nr:response regulator [bacterium]